MRINALVILASLTLLFGCGPAAKVSSTGAVPGRSHVIGFYNL